jgi:hypothetical protein
MERKSAATAASVQNLHDEGADSKSLLERQRWLLRLRNALKVEGAHQELVKLLKPGHRPSRVALHALAAAINMRAAGGKGQCWASVRTLADDIGASRTTIKASLRAFEHGGWLIGRATRAPHGDPGPTIYTLTIPASEADRGRSATDRGQGGQTQEGGAVPDPKREIERDISKERAGALDASPIMRAVKWRDALSIEQRHRLLQRYAQLAAERGWDNRHPGLWHAIWQEEGALS